MKEEVIIIGAGGHGKVIADAIIKLGKYELKGFVDAQEPIGNIIFNGYKVIENQQNIESLINETTKFVIGIGNNEVRKNLKDQLSEKIEWATIIHPTAVIAQDVEIGVGSVVLANTIINAGSTIGEFTIIDSGTIVDHDCEIGDFNHLTIGTLVGSNSKLKISGLKTELGQVYQPFTNL